ncbi:polyketide cyclase/dehydrase/lipid transport protein [Actinocrispum wychmicini]|uniref:Polyketide cyclase/dehydrase/lipid transport protein n=1 Tax=Actinocrispum wychmicini TaxID=1213861 RepID=A0A4V2S8S8_9PSEU|nr:polyketide cyclase/dehydrase/lipid transport protein [Actinocrispum wychmicini]
MEPSATDKITVNAPADQVYDLISDVAEMSALAEETVSNTLLDGARTATVGARFRGSNRRGVRRWSTLATITDASPATQFAFDVTSFGIPIARWQYDIEPTDTGCVVTESTWDRRPRWFNGVGRLITGVADRATVNQRNITATLTRLKAKAEHQ